MDWRLPGAGERGMGSYCLMGTEFLGDEMDSGDGCTTLCVCVFTATELYTYTWKTLCYVRLTTVKNI